jgi:predicted nuclease with RNAse H fold
MTACYFGLDATNDERHPSALAVLDSDAHILAMGTASSDSDILRLVNHWQPASIAIDAPLYLPRGLTNLDDPVAAAALPTGRACERELKSLGIGCFYTTPRSIIKPMVYRSMALRLNLEAQGLLVLEVFPYASKRRLFANRRIPKKTSSHGREWLQQNLLPYISDLASSPPLQHDALDALMAAYTGLLHARGQTEGLGDADEGLLWIPRTDAAQASASNHN